MPGVTIDVVRGVVVVERDGTEVARWPLECDEDALDVAFVGEIARLHLSARRLGCRIRLEHLCPRVRELVELVGLAEVLG